MEFPRKRYLDRLVALEGNSLVKVITGARRSGKSYLLNEIFYKHLLSNGIKKENIIRFAFDRDMDLDLLEPFFPEEPTKIFLDSHKRKYRVNSKKFRSYINSLLKEGESYYIFLDEIQLLDSFVGTLNSFLGNKAIDLYVTGSNSEMLSSQIETAFRGRKSSIHVYPLTYKEVMEGKSLNKIDAYREYLVKGGIPIVQSIEDEQEAFEYLYSLCDEVYLKDVIGNKNVKEVGVLNDLFSLLASSIGSLVSPSKLEKTFHSKSNVRVSDDTIDNYISYFEDAFLLSKAYRYDIKGKNLIAPPYKIYFEDIGVRNARGHFNQIEESHLLENIVYNELRYRGYKVDVGNIYLSKKSGGKDINGKDIYKTQAAEVDFVAHKGMDKIYVQVCLPLNEASVKEREIRSLLSIKDSFKKIIITRDGLKPRRDENGFYIIDILDFLTDSEIA